VGNACLPISTFNGAIPAIYPANFEEIPITLGDIAVGAHIAAFNDPATSDGNKVDAVEIIVF
jgi:hypothetical protein